MPISEAELNQLITRRRAMSGEGYDKARRAVLDYLREQGTITSDECERMKNDSHGH